MNTPIRNWESEFARRLPREVRVMEDAFGRGLEEVRGLLDDYCKLRRETAYVRQSFKQVLMKYGLGEEPAHRLACRLDDWFDDLQTEVVRVLVSRAAP